MRFLPCRELIPVFPPTDESTCASNVVGTWMKSRPRRTAAAAKPARSPITPPPSATIRSPRSIRAARRSSQTFSNWLKLLLDFTRRHNDAEGGKSGGGKRALRRFQMVPGNVLVGHDGNLCPRPKRGGFRTQLGQQAAADDNVVGARTQRHRDDNRFAGTERGGHVTLPREPSQVSGRPRILTRPATISSTITSCSTSRDSIVRSASA